MKHLLLSLGYGTTAAIPVTDPALTGALVAALSQAVCVSYEAGGKYVQAEGEVRMEFIDSAKIVVGDETAVLRAKLEAAEKSNSDLRGYWTQEQAKNKALKEQLEGKAVAA